MTDCACMRTEDWKEHYAAVAALLAVDIVRLSHAAGMCPQAVEWFLGEMVSEVTHHRLGVKEESIRRVTESIATASKERQKRVN